MNNIFNRSIKPWIRPWMKENFDNLYNRDERFFSIVIKGLIGWLNRNIILYNKSINHFIFNTGSSYLYLESNGYEYNLNETTGEDTMYMTLPRSIIQFESINIPTEELSSPFSRGIFEREDDGNIQGYNAEIRRLPLELNIGLKYYLSNFNEILILLQELIDKLVFQKYYNITYLGQIIQCSIEFPGDMSPQINQIDMTSADPNQRSLELSLKICTSYPIINERSAIPVDKVIAAFGHEVHTRKNNTSTDIERKGIILLINDDYIKFKEKLLNPDENNPTEIDKDELAETLYKYDLNQNGIIDEYDISNMLEKIKLNYENEDGIIKYEDILNMLNLLNLQEGYSYEYDSITNKIYIYSQDYNGEINLSKYKIEK